MCNKIPQSLKELDPILYEINEVISCSDALCVWEKEGIFKAIARIIGKEDLLLNWWKALDEEEAAQAGGLD